MRNDKLKKILLNIVILVSCLGITLFYVFHGEDMEQISQYLSMAKGGYWILGVICVVVFILGESVIIRYLLGALGYKETMWNCSLYSFVSFFFSCLTPSATGGQPMQAWFMKKNGVPVHLSSLVLLMVTINYKMVLLIYGFILFVFKPSGVVDKLCGALPWIYLGMLLNLIMVALMLMLAFIPKIAKSIVLFIADMLVKLFPTRKVGIIRRKAERTMNNYVERSKNLGKHKWLMVKVLGITFLQRTILFFTTYLVLVSFGFTALNPLDTVTLQGLISLAVDMLPLPGGMGASEHIFILIFKPILGEGLTVPAMIVSRGLAYYTQLLISAVMTVVAYIIMFGRRGNNRK